ncbi:hypothetical protein K9M78_07575 [Candidatus Bipolaricaulota bacterium]|nr:hypothetical protein [Candidatus Bipolaricaulota bacterium]
MQNRFDKLKFTSKSNADFAVYDRRSKECAGRLIFPHNVSSGHIEPACGTGTVAVTIAMLLNGQIDGKDNLVFESGGLPDRIGGPERTKVNFFAEEGKIIEISFSHSFVQILAEGRIRI